MTHLHCESYRVRIRHQLVADACTVTGRDGCRWRATSIGTSISAWRCWRCHTGTDSHTSRCGWRWTWRLNWHRRKGRYSRKCWRQTWRRRWRGWKRRYSSWCWNDRFSSWRRSVSTSFHIIIIIIIRLVVTNKTLRSPETSHFRLQNSSTNWQCSKFQSLVKRAAVSYQQLYG